jgi:F0F1-type ATP synthase assembly protein I
MLASIVPNLLFRQVFFQHSSNSPQQILKYFYLGAALKFIGFVLLFSLLLHWPDLQVNVFFWAFCLSELARWLYFWLGLPRIITK